MELKHWLLLCAGLVAIVTVAAVVLLLLRNRAHQEEESAPQERLYLHLWNEHNQFLLRIPVDDQLTLGRRNLYQYLQEPITIPMDVTISREHIVLAARGGQILIWNLSEVNPVTINGHRVVDWTLLSAGDRLRLGNSSYMVYRIE